MVDLAVITRLISRLIMIELKDFMVELAVIPRLISRFNMIELKRLVLWLIWV